MRPRVYVYAALLDPSKLAAFQAASRAFDEQAHHELQDEFLRSLALDASMEQAEDVTHLRREVEWRLVYHEPDQIHRMMVKDIEVPDWNRYVTDHGMVYYWPHHDSSLWDTVSEIEFYERINRWPNPYAYLFDRPEIANRASTEEGMNAITLQIDQMNGVIEICSLTELTGFYQPEQLRPISHTRN